MSPRKLKIAMADSRYDKLWKNSEIEFSKLIQRMKRVTRTAETLGAYLNMSKSKQDEKKDVGCYVGGYLTEGKRSKSNLKYRSFITLDADFASQDFVQDMELTAEYSYLIHSTRKHTHDKPRYRLIVPCSRDVSAEEYEAVARKLANDIGIDMFDDSTYQASRLMYWPSVCQDQKYVCEYNDTAEYLDVDKILASYEDWTDVSSWPTSSRVDKIIHKELSKQQDPTTKDGVIGAFCTVYDIRSAIDTFLTDVYEECANGRYTYLEGSTSGGVVVYEDDKFAYSNHATDPAGQYLCNSFDLVRLHKFSELDENAKDNTPAHKMPSFVKMTEFAGKDLKVKKHLHEIRMSEVIDDFKDLEDLDDIDDLDLEDLEKDSLDWLTKLDTDNKGNVYSTISNTLIILQNDERLKNKIVFDTFNNAPYVRGKVPWGKKNDLWTDNDDSRLRYYLESVYRLRIPKATYEDAVSICMYDNAFHPIQDYMNKTKWDGVPRIETLFIDYLAAEDNYYTRAITKLSMVGAVERVFQPGCKFDTAMVLIGGQGLGKTEIVSRLGGEWFSNSLTTFKGKDAFEQLQGSWIIELGELEAMKTAEIDTVKHFMTKRSDKFRGAYQRRTDTHKRQCVFIGTSNTYDFLKDPTGDRRWYPIDVGKGKPKKNLFKELNKEMVAQIWAEAHQLYLEGELSYIKDDELKRLAEQEQLAHREESPYQAIIDNYLNMRIPFNWDSLGIYERKNYIRDVNTLSELDKDMYDVDDLPISDTYTDDIDDLHISNTYTDNVTDNCISITYDDTVIDKRNNERYMQKVCVLQIWLEALDGQKKDLNRAISNEIKRCILRNGEWFQFEKTMHIGSEYGKQKGFKRL